MGMGVGTTTIVVVSYRDVPLRNLPISVFNFRLFIYCLTGKEILVLPLDSVSGTSRGGTRVVHVDIRRKDCGCH